MKRWHQLLWFTPRLKAINQYRQKKFSQAEIHNKHSRNVAPYPVLQTLTWCGRREGLREIREACDERRRVNLCSNVQNSDRLYKAVSPLGGKMSSGER